MLADELRSQLWLNSYGRILGARTDLMAIHAAMRQAPHLGQVNWTVVDGALNTIRDSVHTLKRNLHSGRNVKSALVAVFYAADEDAFTFERPDDMDREQLAKINSFLWLLRSYVTVILHSADTCHKLLTA